MAWAFHPDAAEWQESGFTSWAEIQAWQDAGVTSPKSAMVWRNGRLDPAAAEQWMRYEFSEYEGAMWHGSGFTPRDAWQWKRHGAESVRAVRWRDEGFGAREFAEWSAQMKTPNPGAAAAWRDAGIAAADYDSWLKLRDVSAAAKWVAAGVTDPVDAQNWETYRYTPETAEPHLAAGRLPIEAWWWDEDRGQAPSLTAG